VRFLWPVALALVAGAARADEAALLLFMGRQGCTFGVESRAAAVEAGFSGADIDALIERALGDGNARREGEFVVLGESVCDIRLPDLTSPYTASSPEIVAMTSGIDEFAADGFPGCFLLDPTGAFDDVLGKGEGGGFLEYLRFAGASIAAGRISFYGNSPLTVPPGFQIIDGPCADVSNIAAIRRRQATLQVVFGVMIRDMGETNVCGPDAWPSATIEQMDTLIRFQGGDPGDLQNVGDGVNAWMWMEIFMLTAAAGWHEDMTATDMGRPRPPLCHYP
jgi:hypothetical protein